MDIIVESHIPYIKGILEEGGHNVTYLPPEEFSNSSLKDADVIVIRTRTKVNEALLDGTAVKKVVTATIGTDHIDLDYCRTKGIEVVNAPGCNAPAVAQYVLASIIAAKGADRLADLTLGIVGVGNVGRILDRWARGLGLKTLLNDPPRQAAEGDEGFSSLDEIAREADIITFHTPLDSTTRHLCNAEFLDSLRKKPLIINAARGAIVDTPALIAAIEAGRVSGAAIDCWEGEPDISQRLLDLCAIATPHIAGYSAEGKLRATLMAVKAIDPRLGAALPPVVEAPTIDEIIATYNPLADTLALRLSPGKFEELRNSYHYRREPQKNS